MVLNCRDVCLRKRQTRIYKWWSSTTRPKRSYIQKMEDRKLYCKGLVDQLNGPLPIQQLYSVSNSKTGMGLNCYNLFWREWQISGIWFEETGHSNETKRRIHWVILQWSSMLVGETTCGGLKHSEGIKHKVLFQEQKLTDTKSLQYTPSLFLSSVSL